MIQNKLIIMKALGITELQYGEMVLNSANTWMHRYFGIEEVVISALHHSPSFWKWWINQWENRDCEFLRITRLGEITLPLDVTTRQVTRELYDEHHDAMQLKIQPSTTVAKEVGKLIKIETEKLKELQK